jgi:polysaccharide pyruvyl transferase CsaB
MGYYGMGNLGDEMMLFCLKPWLKERGFDVTVLSERPEVVSKQHALPAVENSPLLGEWAWRTSWLKGGAWRVIRAILRSDSLIIGGGDLIRDDLGWRTFFYTMEKLIVALMLGKKVYVVNVGIGQPSTGYGRLVLRWVLARCHGIIVRDLQSEQICKQLGVSSAVLAPDIVLSLPEILGKRPGASVNELPAEPCVTVCLRHNPNVFGRYSMNEPQIRTLARALDDLVEKRGVNVVFIPFQENPASGEGDSQLHQVVAQGMVHKDRVLVRPWTADFDEVCRWIRGARFVLSMRLHAAVLAQAYGRPSVLMPCDRKIREFGRLMNIRHVIEAISLDEVAKVSSVLESAWLEAQEKKDMSRQSVASLWAGLRLDSA